MGRLLPLRGIAARSPPRVRRNAPGFGIPFSMNWFSVSRASTTDSAPARREGVDVNATLAQAGLDPLGVIGRHEEDRRRPLFETFANEAADDATQGVRAFVELHGVIARGMGGLSLRRPPRDVVRPGLSGGDRVSWNRLDGREGNLFKVSGGCLSCGGLLHERTVAGHD